MAVEGFKQNTNQRKINEENKCVLFSIQHFENE
jgi:hypothetical protein